jgi:hypothetical protein
MEGSSQGAEAPRRAADPRGVPANPGGLTGPGGSLIEWIDLLATSTSVMMTQAIVAPMAQGDGCCLHHARSVPMITHGITLSSALSRQPMIPLIVMGRFACPPTGALDGEASALGAMPRKRAEGHDPGVERG